MSELMVVGFPDEQRAQEVWDECRAKGDGPFDDFHDGAVIVHRKDNTFEVRAGHRPLSEGLSWSHFWEYLAGLTLLVPVIGVQVVSAVYDAFARAANSSRIDSTVRDEIRQLVVPGTSALLGIIRTANPDDLEREFESRGGEVIRTPLGEGDEERLQDAIHARGLVT